MSVISTVHEVLRALDPAAAEAGVILRPFDEPELPMVEADAGRFLQILMNLASNAIKYNRPGGSVTIAASQPESCTVLLKGSPATRDIPVVAVTAAASAVDRERGRIAGFDHYVTKPLVLDELEQVLRSLLA